ncbi:unnamed protein product [Pylaiella littoralis]
MRAPRWVIFGAASHVCCCAQASLSSSNDIIGPNCLSACRDRRYRYSPLSSAKETQQKRKAARRSWLVTGGGTKSAVAAEGECHSRWWRSRKRWAKRQAELAAKEAAEGCPSLVQQIARKQVIVVQGMLRRLKRWLGALVDITTLRRVRLLRKARQGSWQHGGPIPARYRGILQELRNEIAAKPGLERRAKRVHHELDAVALGRYLEAAFWSLEHDGHRVSRFIEETIAWREKVRADRLRKEDVLDEGKKGAIIVKGHDLSSRPVVYFRPALDGKMEGDGNSKLMIYNLERAIRLMPRNSWQYTIVIDCQGMGLKQLPPVAYMKKMFKLLSHHYPMRLGHVLFTNVGPSVMLCWRVVSPLLQARTKAKMHFIPSTKLAQTSKYIHPTQLLSFVGGNSQWHFDPAIYFSSDAASL